MLCGAARRSQRKKTLPDTWGWASVTAAGQVGPETVCDDQGEVD